jgi:hypothetical protein
METNPESSRIVIRKMGKSRQESWSGSPAIARCVLFPLAHRRAQPRVLHAPRSNRARDKPRLHRAAGATSLSRTGLHHLTDRAHAGRHADPQLTSSAGLHPSLLVIIPFIKWSLRIGAIKLHVRRARALYSKLTLSAVTFLGGCSASCR